MKEEHAEKKQKPQGNQKLLSQADELAALIPGDDPLQEVDIYATVKKEDSDDKVIYTNTHPEDTEMDEDISNLLTQTFNTEKKKSNFV